MKKILSMLLVLVILSIFVFSLNVFADESDVASDTTIPQATVSDKIFQSASLGIMTIGIIGIPVYFILNMRKKRLLQEYDEKNRKDDNNNTEDNE